MKQEHTLRPDFHLVVTPHDMSWWQLPPEHSAVIDWIETVWLFDKNVHVHCCEITPSYELWPLETRVRFKDSFDQDANESLRDRFEEDVRGWSADEVEYRHVSDLDWFLAKEGTQQFAIGDLFEGVSYETCPYDEHRDAALEYYRCNSAI